MKTLSSKPSKQRKFLYVASLHIRHKIMSAPLSKELRSEYKTRSIPIREGDTVVVTRGNYAGIEGKVISIDAQKYRASVESVKREKIDGSPVYVSISPSKIMIKKLNTDDKWRKEILNRRKTGKVIAKVSAKKVGGK